MRRSVLAVLKQAIENQFRASAQKHGRLLPRAAEFLVTAELAKRVIPPSSFLRQIHEETRPFHPLSGEALPSVELMIPCIEMDLAIVVLAVQVGRESCLNPMARITVVSPARDQPGLKQALGTEVSFIADEELDLPKTAHAFQVLVPGNVEDG